MNWGIFAGIILIAMLIVGGIYEVLKKPSHIKTSNNVKSNSQNKK